MERGQAAVVVNGVGGFHIVGLVPDGVTRVLIDFHNGSSAMARVANTFFDYDLGRVTPRFAADFVVKLQRG